MVQVFRSSDMLFQLKNKQFSIILNLRDFQTDQEGFEALYNVQRRCAMVKPDAQLNAFQLGLYIVSRFSMCRTEESPDRGL